MKLDKEEKELLESFENDEWLSDPLEDLNKYKEIAKFTVKKNKRINIRLTQKDYDGIQKRALKEGIPYQTMTSGIIHKYLSNQLIDIK